MNQSNIAWRLPDTVPASARLFLNLLGRIQHGHLQLVTPLGDRLLLGDTRQGPAATLNLHDWRACGLILKSGDIGFGEAWRDGWCDSPDIVALLRLALANEQTLRPALFGGRVSKIWYGLCRLLNANSRAGSKRNIHAHYDLGNDFYRLWLDHSMTYSSAWFAGDFSQDLARAQQAKYQRILDALGIRPGSRVLEIGCGWGGFAEHAALLGIHVHGITLSQAQLDYAQRRIAAAGLTKHVTLSLTDYRDLQGQYDHIVSIEMFEAVGESYWPGYFRTLRDRLHPGGSALVQTITIDESRFARYRASTDFIQQFIFPGGMLPSPQRFAAQAVSAGLKIKDTLAFGRDYAETLRRWRVTFESQKETVLAQGFDESFLRLWRLYLAYCEAGFDAGTTDVYQYHLVRTS